MARITGEDGVVKIGTVTVAAVKSFSYEVTAGTAVSSIQGRRWDHHVATKFRATGTFQVEYDPTETSHSSLVIGAEVTLLLYPDGDATGKPLITIPSVLNSMSSSVDPNEIVMKEFSFSNNGNFVEGTVV
jgi:hypothetical protein